MSKEDFELRVAGRITSEEYVERLRQRTRETACPECDTAMHEAMATPHSVDAIDSCEHEQRAYWLCPNCGHSEWKTNEKLSRWWYWPPWTLTNPVWPWFWRGGDEQGRSTIVIQPPLLGALIIPVSLPCRYCAMGECERHD